MKQKVAYDYDVSNSRDGDIVSLWTVKQHTCRTFF